jgi:hypothetical protein
MVFVCLALVSFAHETSDSPNSIPQSCTIFTASIGNRVIFGNNEDYSNPNTYYWAVPPSDGKYGGVYFGFDDFWPQGGVNEVGLAFDINALEEAPLNPHPGLPSLNDYEGYVVLRSCATVEEAIELVKGYNWGEAMWGQIHFADASGDAVVVSAGRDKELAFTRKKEGDGSLVSTNFNLAFNSENAREGLCWRYDKTVAMLAEAETGEDLTVEYCREILDAVHVEGASVNTLYSNIFDLRNGDIYICYFHQFNEVAKLNATEEIAKNSTPTPIKNLFSEGTLEKATSEYEEYKSQEGFRNALLLAIPLVVIGLIFLALRKRRKT